MGLELAKIVSSFLFPLLFSRVGTLKPLGTPLLYIYVPYVPYVLYINIIIGIYKGDI